MAVFLLLILYPVLSLETKDILKELSWATQLKLLKDMPSPKDRSEPSQMMALPEYDFMRQVGLEALHIVHRTSLDAEENELRLKLFRLMHDSVKDSDYQVKRAEQIKDEYENSTDFEIGYLFGNINEKFGIIRETAANMKKFFHEWKPIEHVNAYEQVANSAVAIRQLVDWVRIAAKNTTTTLRKP